MATVLVIQRHARLAAHVRFDTVPGRDGPVPRARFTTISNHPRGLGEQRQDEATPIPWTAWGRLAELCAACLLKGSHVNVVGQLRQTHHADSDGSDVYGLNFVADEVDFLDTREVTDARRERAHVGPVAGGAPVAV